MRILSSHLKIKLFFLLFYIITNAQLHNKTNKLRTTTEKITIKILEYKSHKHERTHVPVS